MNQSNPINYTLQPTSARCEILCCWPPKSNLPSLQNLNQNPCLAPRKEALKNLSHHFQPHQPSQSPLWHETDDHILGRPSAPSLLVSLVDQNQNLIKSLPSLGLDTRTRMVIVVGVVAGKRVAIPSGRKWCLPHHVYTYSHLQLHNVNKTFIKTAGSYQNLLMSPLRGGLQPDY